MKKILLTSIVVALCFAAACTVSRNTNPAANNQAQQQQTPVSAATSATAEQVVQTSQKAETKDSQTDCKNVNAGDFKVWAKQTFPVDFKPYQKACFVTLYNPEYDDPPLESQFAIFREGEKIFDFPEQFNGVKFGCWVDAVAFEDLNGDELKEVIVIGKCSAKTSEYNENMVYVNTGDDFRTDVDANYKLADFSKIKEVNDFVRKNKSSFFKN